MAVSPISDPVIIPPPFSPPPPPIPPPPPVSPPPLSPPPPFHPISPPPPPPNLSSSSQLSSGPASHFLSHTSPLKPLPFASSLNPFSSSSSVIGESVQPFNVSEPKWSSLFKKRPKNAGVYLPRDFKIDKDGKPNQLPEEVKNEGIKFWSDHLVGFFLDGSLSYLTVTNHLKRIWKLKGEVDIKSDNENFYFKFSNEQDKMLILQSDPIFIKGKMFIINLWNPTIGCVKASIRKVPIWVHFYKIPTIAWTLMGINWLACHIGRLICFDENTEKLKRFKYAKALIEIEPNQKLPDFIEIDGLGESGYKVRIEYDWKPSICDFCKVFGHTIDNCMESAMGNSFEIFNEVEFENKHSEDSNFGKGINDVNFERYNSMQVIQSRDLEKKNFVPLKRKNKIWKRKVNFQVDSLVHKEISNGNVSNLESDGHFGDKQSSKNVKDVIKDHDTVVNFSKQNHNAVHKSSEVVTSNAFSVLAEMNDDDNNNLQFNMVDGTNSPYSHLSPPDNIILPPPLSDKITPPIPQPTTSPKKLISTLKQANSIPTSSLIVSLNSKPSLKDNQPTEISSMKLSVKRGRRVKTNNLDQEAEELINDVDCNIDEVQPKSDCIVLNSSGKFTRHTRRNPDKLYFPNS
jgi:hypothetical protein